MARTKKKRERRSVLGRESRLQLAAVGMGKRAGATNQRATSCAAAGWACFCRQGCLHRSSYDYPHRQWLCRLCAHVDEAR